MALGIPLDLGGSSCSKAREKWEKGSQDPEGLVGIEGVGGFSVEPRDLWDSGASGIPEFPKISGIWESQSEKASENPNFQGGSSSRNEPDLFPNFPPPPLFPNISLPGQNSTTGIFIEFFFLPFFPFSGGFGLVWFVFSLEKGDQGRGLENLY